MIQKKPKYFKLFLLILLISSILRFWRIDALTTFSGDQGYDFLAVANMMKTHKITFLGPKIGPYNNIGNLYLGPAYYYLLSPALFLSGFDPLGPAVETAIMAVLTVYLIYLIGKNFLNDESGLVASALYGFNPYLISQSRAPSNPHMIPFFCALFIYSILKTVNSKFYLWPVLCGICLGVMFQLHYLAAVLIVVSVLYLLKKKQMTSLIVVLAAFVLTISPQIIFELRHEFFVTNLFFKQLTQGDNIFSLSYLFFHILTSFKILSAIFLSSSKLLIGSFLAVVLFVIANVGNIQKKEPVVFLIFTIFVGFLAANLYAGSIEPHYFAIIYVPIALTFGFVVSSLYKKAQPSGGIYLLSFFLVLLFFGYFKNLDLSNTNGYTMPKGWNLPGIRKASRLVSSDADNSKNFNIAATLDGDTRAMPYRYLVTVYGKNPQNVESYPSADVIYLISRDSEDAIKSYNVWEISSFSPFTIVNSWDIQNGVKVFKLAHNPL